MNNKSKMKNNIIKLKAVFVTLPLTLAMSQTVMADQVILDDLIIDGSICAGMDCVNGESFGFDTIRLKENNLRIKFQDTSNSASFPSNDWQITANDSSNGGANKFSIDDIDGGRTPFTIEAGAPSHSLYVEDGGRIGIGTNTPVVQMHVKDGNSPTLRLEQDGSSGFTPQTWDVAGNEANFFVRDATNGSTLPFRIFPGAPSDALSIAANGKVGLGTTSPSTPLHIRRTDGTASITIEDVSGATSGRELLHLINNGGSYIAMENTSTNNVWYVVNENAATNDLILSRNSGGAAFRLTESGDLTILGTLTTAGTECNTGCDKVFSSNFELETIDQHAEFMFENSHLESVGPTIENEPFNITQKTTGMLNELEKAHIYISQLNSRIKSLEEKLEASN